MTPRYRPRPSRSHRPPAAARRLPGSRAVAGHRGHPGAPGVHRRTRGADVTSPENRAARCPRGAVQNDRAVLRSFLRHSPAARLRGTRACCSRSPWWRVCWRSPRSRASSRRGPVADRAS
ncbi:hypothetical protein QJS66_10105 [Kocuria rhizophila]|nr:hypothetical protein QJS66_10105 [Kocuria rhizophila]